MATGLKHPGSNADWGITDWKDQLLPGASRQSKPWDGNLDAGHVLDTFGVPQERNDWVSAGGVPVISGSSEYWQWVNNGIRPGASTGGGSGKSGGQTYLQNQPGYSSFMERFFPDPITDPAKVRAGANVQAQQPEMSAAEKVLAQLIGMYY